MSDADRYLHFVYTPMFEASAKGLLSEDDRRRLEDVLLENPRAGAVMQGTGGFRKVRFALPGRGKSGSARVVYYFLGRRGQVYFIVAFPRNAKANLTKQEQNELRAIAKALEEEA